MLYNDWDRHKKWRQQKRQMLLTKDIKDILKKRNASHIFLN